MLALANVASAADKDLWSLKSSSRPTPPAVASDHWVRNPIDRFILAILETRNLAHSLEADRRTLIRRLSFDLHGLPPTPERIERFVVDPDPMAYEKLVNELLDSPHFGERWARHWLDIAHYADTHGFERDKRRDNAWPYRDYVIRAFNDDKPYDHFIREQIAGDVIAPDDRDAVIATGFLAAGPWDYVGQVETKSPVLRRAARADDLDDIVTQVMTATVAMTVNCARCHDHKLDPISQREYYNLWSVFAGVKRDERDISATEAKRFVDRKQDLEARLSKARFAVAKLQNAGIDLADIVGGGNGFGTGVKGNGVDARTGKVQTREFGALGNVRSNRFVRVAFPFIDGVVIPDGGPDGGSPVPISSTGLHVTGVPDTASVAWDMIRNGPVASQFSTALDGVDFNKDGRSLLGLHANAAITFDLAAIRKTTSNSALRFNAIAGYGGKAITAHADFHVYVDGQIKARQIRINRDDGGFHLDIPLPASARFLTLMATDGGNGYSHDQIFFGDPRLIPAQNESTSINDAKEIARLKREESDLLHQLKSLGSAPRIYGVKTEKPAPVKVLHRGSPETASKIEARPGSLASVTQIGAAFGHNTQAEGDRRKALAEWIVDPMNPLTRRVIVNRLWHYHFGRGLVDTPSDFGFGGTPPSHPLLLDWLADELLRQRWSLKAMHRLMVTSAAYRQQSAAGPDHPATRIDADNRLLWRMNPRRLDAESVRDAILTVTGKLNPKMGGPGYEDFTYQDAYAPIYKYITPDRPELWRRSIYRYVVRTTPHQFMTTLDCPNPANLTPSRVTTTTALQSLALQNNEFILNQAEYFAERITRETDATPQAATNRAFQLVFGRSPRPDESVAATGIINDQSLFTLCRMLLNANEFVYVD
jgi:hypothetical protein